MIKLDGDYVVIYDAKDKSTGFEYGVAHEYGTRFIPIGSVDNPLKYRSMSGKHSMRPFIRPAIRRVLAEISRLKDMDSIPDSAELTKKITWRAKYYAPRYKGFLVKSIRCKKK